MEKSDVKMQHLLLFSLKKDYFDKNFAQNDKYTLFIINN